MIAYLLGVATGLLAFPLVIGALILRALLGGGSLPFMR